MEKDISIFETEDELSRQVDTVTLAALPESGYQQIGKYYEEKFLLPLGMNMQRLKTQLDNIGIYLSKHGEILDIGNNLVYMRTINAVFQSPGANSLSQKEQNLSWKGRKGALANKKELYGILMARNFLNLGSWIAFVPAEWETEYDKHYRLADNRIGESTAGYNYHADRYWLYLVRLGDTYKPASYFDVFQFLAENHIVPPGFDEFDRCIEFYNSYRQYISISFSSTVEFDFDRARADFRADRGTIDGKTYSQLMDAAKKGDYPADIDFTGSVEEFFLNSDYRRAQFAPYEKALLTEHTQGHWDLADHETGGGITVKLKTPLFARNPHRDIQQGSVIGIDFGTKSTIVSLLDATGRPIPIPVGGKYGSPQQKDYENPTALHLCDFDAFIAQYGGKAGRPETSWNTFTVSHTAKGELDEANDANYYSFVTNLKQWAATDNEKLELTDDKQKLHTIEPFLSGNAAGVDLIEIYAYYIGLAINNMRRNAIYTNYLLSFPVTFRKEIREKIRESFTRGLIKSLPNVLARDDAFLKNRFRVTSGTSEPAAYAVCALQAFGFQPSDAAEVYYYGVFDFGGGTTDFDFGLWRTSNGEGEEEDRDYVIEHFNAGGDRFLGGENLLEYLAFLVFSHEENQDKLRTKNLWFTFPPDPYKREKFSGYESLINQNSKWANLNMHKMKEALRPVWEKHENYRNNFPEGSIRNIILFNNEGVQVSDITLTVDLELLDREIEERIRSGVKDFLAGMLRAMSGREPQPRKLHIFLAGNSCKSEVVRKVFDEECKAIEDDFREKIQNEHGREPEESLFEIFPPLGSDEAFAKMEERGILIDRDDKYLPTGKTGVAIGLVLSRPGSPILVKNANVDSSGEIRFKYIVGKNRRSKLEVALNPDTPLNGDWVSFMRRTDTIEFYYTSKPSGMSGDFPITETKRIIRHLPAAESDAYVFIRPVSPEGIEYMVARSNNGVPEGNPIFGPEKLKLEEG